MNTFVTADQHFGHFNIISYTGRPYSSAENMDNDLIEKWNSVVDDKDEIYILGDLIWTSYSIYAEKILKSLNGKKYLVEGNHDHRWLRFKALHKYFEWIKKYHILQSNGKEFNLFHYPIYEWNNYFHGSIHLFGHVHQNYFNIKGKENQSYNVGVDVNDFTPISIENIIEKLKSKEERKIDYVIQKAKNMNDNFIEENHDENKRT